MMLECLCGRRFNGERLPRCPACKMPTARVRLITPEQREAKLQEDRRRAIAEEERARMTEEEREQQIRERRESYISDALGRMERSLAEGRTPALHTVHLMTAQYSVAEQIGGLPPSVDSWAVFGWEGWEVVSAFPHTTGLALTNYVGKSIVHGGGIGGLVDGVHLILRFQVTREILTSRREYVEQMIGQIYDQQQLQTSLPAIPEIPSGVMESQASTSGAASAKTAAGGAFIGYGIAYAQSSDTEDAGNDGDIAGDGGGDWGGFDF